MRSRRMSRNRYWRRVPSATVSVRSEIGNGGASAAFRTSTTQSWISMPPVGSLSLTFSAGRAATVPVTRTTNSARTSTVLSTTHWVTPV